MNNLCRPYQPIASKFTKTKTLSIASEWSNVAVQLLAEYAIEFNFGFNRIPLSKLLSDITESIMISIKIGRPSWTLLIAAVINKKPKPLLCNLQHDTCCCLGRKYNK